MKRQIYAQNVLSSRVKYTNYITNKFCVKNNAFRQRIKKYENKNNPEYFFEFFFLNKITKIIFKKKKKLTIYLNLDAFIRFFTRLPLGTC